MVDDAAHERIRQVIDSHFEWLLVPDDGNSFPIDCTEIDIIDRDEKVLFGFVDDRGYHAWRLNDFSEAENGIKLDLAGAFGRKRAQFRLVPRTSARELANEIEAARLLQANEIANALRGAEFCKKVTRVALAKDNGRIAEIFFRSANGPAAAIIDVSRAITPEVLLSTAILRREALSGRKKDRIETLWIFAEKKRAARSAIAARDARWQVEKICQDRRDRTVCRCGSYKGIVDQATFRSLARTGNAAFTS